MKRREFITLLGGAAAWPIAARAQQGTIPVIGFLGGGSIKATNTAAYRNGLSETGYVEGRNLTIEYRFAENQYDRLPALATELVRRRVSVILATPSPAALAAKAATTTVPIVFTSGFDPVRLGLIESFNRPGGNLTGVTYLTGALGSKKLDLLSKVAPNAALIAVLVNPTNPGARSDMTDMIDLQEAARGIERKLIVVEAGTENELDIAFTSLVQHRAAALVVFADQRARIATLAARHAVPAIYESRVYAEAGGLMSYGTNLRDANRLAGLYVGRILKGEKPADLPVVQPTKLELVINLKTAKALGLTVPDTVLALADEVIE
jgi:putative ABC transport system substrate-binding protein